MLSPSKRKGTELESIIDSLTASYDTLKILKRSCRGRNALLAEEARQHLRIVLDELHTLRERQQADA